MLLDEEELLLDTLEELLAGGFWGLGVPDEPPPPQPDNPATSAQLNTRAAHWRTFIIVVGVNIVASRSASDNQRLYKRH